MSEDGERIGDAERQAAANRLGDHLEAGRITVEEHAERVDAVFAARTDADLAIPFRDLPDTVPATRTAAEAATVPGSSSPDLWQRAAAVTSSLSVVLFFIFGFALDGWSWAWLVFLVPGALGGASAARRD